MKKTFLALAVGALCALSATQTAADPFAAPSGSAGAQDNLAQITLGAQAFAAPHPDWAQPFLVALYRDGEWGAVLNLERLGLAAMQKQHFDLARKALDKAIARVEMIYTHDPNAADARSVFNAEKVKDFKGEPYERAMMYYYRGLLYLQEGDYQNGRAAFLAADRHDTLSSAEDQAFAGDFGLMKYLAGWASACDGDNVRARQLIEEARAADASIRSLPAPPLKSLILLDLGPAPVKWGSGAHKEILKFKAGDGDDAAPTLVTVRERQITAHQVAGDVTFQAMTRGGREVDGIMAGKAQFKDTANAIGDTALSVGRQLAATANITGDRNMAGMGLAGLFIGLIAKGVESAANPAADVRAWDSLPARVLLYTSDLAADDPIAMTAAGKTVPLPLQSTQGDCSLAWGRTRSALSTSFGGSANLEADGAAETHRGDRNRAFRAMLGNDLAVVSK